MPRKIKLFIKLQGCLDDVPEWALLRGSLEGAPGGGLWRQSLEGVSGGGLWRGSNIIGKEQNFTTIYSCFSTKTRLESSKYHVDFVFTH